MTNFYKNDLRLLYELCAKRGGDWCAKRLLTSADAHAAMKTMEPLEFHSVVTGHDDDYRVVAYYLGEGDALAHAAAVEEYEYERCHFGQLPQPVSQGCKTFRVTMDLATGDHVVVDRFCDEDDATKGKLMIRYQAKRKVFGTMYKDDPHHELECYVWAVNGEFAVLEAERRRNAWRRRHPDGPTNLYESWDNRGYDEQAENPTE